MLRLPTQDRPSQDRPASDERGLGVTPTSASELSPSSGRHFHLPLIRGDERGRPGLLPQALIITVFLIAYDALRNLAPGRISTSLANARSVLTFERSIHLSPEHAMNAWLTGHFTLGRLAGDFYDSAHYAVTIVMLIVIYVSFPGSYRRLRNVVIVTNAIGLLGFWLFPLAPPRMLPGFHDTVAITHALGGWSTAIESNADEYAAMPSLHVGWALWVLLSMVIITRGRRHRRPLIGLAALHAALTVTVILATANHYVSDAAAGALCLLLSVLVVGALGWVRTRWRDRQLAAPSRAHSPLDSSAGAAGAVRAA